MFPEQIVEFPLVETMGGGFTVTVTEELLIPQEAVMLNV